MRWSAPSHETLCHIADMDSGKGHQFTARTMNNDKIIVLEFLQLSCKLSLRLFELLKPFQCTMVCSNGEWSTEEVLLKVFKKCNHCKELFSSYTIVSFRILLA